MTTTVVNIRDTKDYDVYVGREVKNGYYNLKGFSYANPYYLVKESDRDKVYSQYEQAMKALYRFTQVNWWLLRDMDLQLDLLKGKRLACWCAPKKCHADLLAKLADMTYQERWEWANDS